MSELWKPGETTSKSSQEEIIRYFWIFLHFIHMNLFVRLKVGAKSKKDPHIRVGGRTEESVVRAKMMITEVLDTTTNSRQEPQWSG